MSPITFQPLAAQDIPLLHEWLCRPHVRQWWGDPGDPQTVAADYLPLTDPASPDRAYIALLDGEPVGYIQSYCVMGDAAEGWWPDESDPGARGIDQFLADGGRLGQGLGTRMVQAFVARLFADPAVTRIQVDPAPANARAIACYRRAGFADAGLVDTPDGPARLMLLPRPK